MSRHFIIVGAQRCGTTGLVRLLEQHPAICMARPMRPEPKFFLEPDALAAGYAAYRQRFFAHHDGQPVLGEKSTSYIERADARRRLRAMLPEAQLLFVLRDPVRRAWSNWRFSRAHGLETLDFEQALAAEPERLHNTADAQLDTSVSPYAYATRGDYVRYLDAWAEVFPREQFLIVLSEALFAGHDAVRGIFRRLDVDPDVPLNAVGRVNGTGQASTPLPEAAGARLRSQFQVGIRELAQQWQVDTSAWQ